MTATFLHACALPDRWQRRERFTVLDTGFGAGGNFIAAWQAWRDDPLRCERLTFIAIDTQPLSPAELRAAAATASAIDCEYPDVPAGRPTAAAT